MRPATINHTGAEATLQQGDQVVTAGVKRRKLNNFGDAVGMANLNPIMDVRLHMLEFQDGVETKHSANVIVANMWAHCKIDGNMHHHSVEAIIDQHESDVHMQFNVQMATLLSTAKST
jgi:hypothetical protein